jgi:hypothetical protein
MAGYLRPADDSRTPVAILIDSVSMDVLWVLFSVVGGAIERVGSARPVRSPVTPKVRLTLAEKGMAYIGQAPNSIAGRLGMRLHFMGANN